VTLGRAGIALCVVLAVAAPVAGADAWTIQTVAIRDFREAQAIAADLRDQGFPSYTEFSMSAGQQWVRVRVGCWQGRDGADGMVEVLRGLVTREAVAVPVTAGAPVTCIDVDVGFIKPARYEPLHLAGELPTYRVEVADHVAYVRHDGQRWLVVQGVDPPLPAPAPDPTALFRAGEIRGFAVVFVDGAGAPEVVCPGRLVGQVGHVAVVEWANAIVACAPRNHER
jgi:hypothetical protein